MTIEYWKNLWYSVSIALREKCPNMELFLIPYFSVFRLNTGKYGPEKSPYSDTFHTVLETAVKILSQTSCHYAFKPEDPYTITCCT